jgi:uncharacterized membrane protein HdeD (DUF308 family)
VIVEVFDDWKSIVHVVVGGATYFFSYYQLFSFFPLFAIIFILYELIEYWLKYDNIKYTVGDLLEFTTGYTVTGLLCINIYS